MPDRAAGAATRRLFFALWPDAALREAAAALVEQLVPRGMGRPQRPDQLHVTLAFLGDVPERRLADVHAAAQASPGATFTIEFDALEHWRMPRVLCLVATDVPPPLAALVGALQAALATRQLPVDDRPFRPHLTLARKLARFDGPASIEPLVWPATTLTLVESRTDPAGVRYEVLGSWPLATPPMPG
jgi:2'-5' RNA ligase